MTCSTLGTTTRIPSPLCATPFPPKGGIRGGSAATGPISAPPCATLRHPENQGGASLPTIDELIARGALFVVNHSAGKDSQAMFLIVRERVPAAQLLVVHAHLPEVEWEGSLDHIRATIDDAPLIVAQAPKTFFQMVEHRRAFPSPSTRQCTSDLKRGPIEREIRRYLAAHPEFGGLVVNCMGMRSQESPGRAKLEALKLNARNSKAGRSWFDWLPVHELSARQVFDRIRGAGQEPFWTYAQGMKRKSCCFCIMACRSDLTIAARLRPELYARYVETERRLGFTLSMSRKPLPIITGINPEGEEL